MWNHGVHLLSGSAMTNMQPLQGTTTYIICPPSAQTPSACTVILHTANNG